MKVKGPRRATSNNAMVGATAQLPDSRDVFLWPNVAVALELADTGVEGLFPPPPAGAAAPHRTAGSSRCGHRAAARATTSERCRSTTARARGRGRVSPTRGRSGAEVHSARHAVMLDTPYPVEFVDEGEQIVMRLEEWDGTRTIYMNPGDGPPVQEHSPKGISFGRWEGKTLAIFTTYIDYPFLDDLGTPQSKA